MVKSVVMSAVRFWFFFSSQLAALGLFRESCFQKACKTAECPLPPVCTGGSSEARHSMTGAAGPGSLHRCRVKLGTLASTGL